MTENEIIDETAAYYSEDISRRASIGGECEYLLPDGRMCAVGRCLIPGSLIRYERVDLPMAATSGISADRIENLENILKPEYRGYPSEFWSKLQNFHDNEGNWNEKGLTKQGKKILKNLKENY